MGRGCSLLLFGAALLLFVATAAFMNDPVRALWALADMNGGMSKWEDRTVRITSIERDCHIDEAVAAEQQLDFDADNCDSSANLRNALDAKLRSQVMGQPCFDDGPGAKTCPGIHPLPYHGTATITVTGVNESDGEFTSKLHVSSDDVDNAYYVLRSGDVLKVGVCRSNPHIARLGAHWAAVKGC